MATKDSKGITKRQESWLRKGMRATQPTVAAFSPSTFGNLLLEESKTWRLAVNEVMETKERPSPYDTYEDTNYELDPQQKSLSSQITHSVEGKNIEEDDDEFEDDFEDFEDD